MECPSGGNRICAVAVQSEPPLLVVSTFFPSRKYVTKNSTSADPFEYESVLTQLNQIVSTYQFSHEIIICGDMNASLQLRLGNKQDQAFTSFIRSLDLKSYQTGKPTFFHENGRDTSEIDYILTKCHSAVIQSPITVEDKQPLNLSDHTLLSTKLCISYSIKHKESEIVPVKPKWHKRNLGLFKETVHTLIHQSFLHKVTNSPYDLHCQIRCLTDILKSATEISIPGYTSTKLMTTKPKSRKWNSQVTEAISMSRKVWGDWKMAGKPDKEDNPDLHNSIKAAKTNLQKSIRKTNANDRESELQSIMDSENNTKSFHTLVRLQRKPGCHQTNSLIVDGIYCESPPGSV